jgi:leader peptidase (prepilin peptidase)/N-methyltransferase
VLGRDGALDVVLGLLLVTALVPITLIDLDRRLIPNAITLPAAVAAVVVAVARDVSFVP